MPGRARRLTSETGDISRGVLVAVMVRATPPAAPSPDRKPRSTLRAADAAAGRAGLRCRGFIDLGVCHPCVIAFVSEVVAQPPPSGIEHALCHTGLCHRRGRDGPDRDLARAIHQRPRELVQAVPSPAGDPGVDRQNLPPALLAPCLTTLGFQVAREPRLLKLRAVGALRDGPQPEIDPDLGPSRALTALDLVDARAVPAAQRVLREVARLDPAFRWPMRPETEGHPAQNSGRTIERHIVVRDWHPAERPFRPSARAPTQLRTPPFADSGTRRRPPAPRATAG